MFNPIKNKYELMWFVSVSNGCLNADTTGIPRVDLETGTGLVSDVSTKRDIRDTIPILYPNVPGMDISVKKGIAMTGFVGSLIEEAGGKKEKDKKANAKMQASCRETVCQRYIDARAFGATLTGSGNNAGSFRGPVQVEIGETVSPVDARLLDMTRVCHDTDAENGTFGNKWYIPFGLYTIKAHVNPCVAEQTGFSEDDLQVILEAIYHMYDMKASASTGAISLVSPVILFKHVGLSDAKTNAEQNERSAKLGCAHAYKLFEQVVVKEKETLDHAPRSHRDYEATINFNGIPRGVEIGFYNGFSTSWGKLPDDEDWFTPAD